MPNSDFRETAEPNPGRDTQRYMAIATGPSPYAMWTDTNPARRHPGGRTRTGVDTGVDTTGEGHATVNLGQAAQEDRGDQVARAGQVRPDHPEGPNPHTVGTQPAVKQANKVKKTIARQKKENLNQVKLFFPPPVVCDVIDPCMALYIG